MHHLAKWFLRLLMKNKYTANISFQYFIKLNTSVMKNLLLLFGVCTIALLAQTNIQAQNVFSGEPVQWVGRPNGYSTTPYNSDYRTMGYRKISTTVSNPNDGRGQWTTTINVQSSGGDIAPDNMPGGGGAGWLLISGPSGNRFQNKWNFSGVGQGALNSVNNVGFNVAQDMGLDMSPTGRYTFVFKDAGYTASAFYVGYTANVPVTVTNGGTTFSNSQPVIAITTSAAPSSGENVYVRYRVTTNDFTTGTSVVQATGSGTAWSATLPQQNCGNTVYYYIYTTTRTLTQINADSESDRSLSALRYDDNAGANYSFTVSPVPTAGITNNSGTTILTCAQTSISVTATGGASYSWDNGLGNGASKSITAPGTYTVTVTGNNGCTSAAQIVITQNLSNNTFSGTGNWTDNARWSCGTPPGSGSTITIAAGSNVTLNTDFTVAGSLTMTATSALTINPTRTLSISGTADFAGQSVTFQSDGTGTASLGQVTGILNGATNVTVERYIPNNGFRSWRLLSVPVITSQTIRQAWQEGIDNPNPKDNNVFNRGTQITGVFTTQAAAAAAGFDSTSVQAGMLRWNGTGWSNITSTNQPINNFSSYFLYIRGDRSLTVTGAVSNSSATKLRTKGTVYTSDQVTNVGANAFALVPNLYPSAINFTGLTRTGGVNNLFYIWDSKKQSGVSLGVYQTFSNTNSFNCLVGGGSYTLGQPNTAIESGQSFFVTSSTAGTITLKESAKVSGTNGSLGFRPLAIKSKIDTRLYSNTDDMLDANTVVFDAAYSNAVAEEDAPKLGNPGANFAIETNSKLLAIEGTSSVKENDAIQFRMWNVQQGNYKLEFAVSNMNNSTGLSAMLEDSYLKTSTAINMEGTTTVNFTIDNNAGSSSASRFRIVFSKAKPIVTESKQGYNIAPNPIENGVMNVAFKNQPAGKYNIRIIAEGGQSVMVKAVTHTGGNAVQNIALPAAINSGTYVVEIVAPNSSKTVNTVIVKKK
jgi:hypothetical protein